MARGPVPRKGISVARGHRPSQVAPRLPPARSGRILRKPPPLVHDFLRFRVTTMDPQFYDRMWDTAHEAWRSAKLPRSLARKHPIVADWLADDARGGDPAINPLHFLHRPHLRHPARLRRLRIFNTLLLTLEREGFGMALDRPRRALLSFGPTRRNAATLNNQRHDRPLNRCALRSPQRQTLALSRA